MRISLIGSGNVATHLGAALKNAGHQIIEVCSRDPQHAALLAYHLKAEVTPTPAATGSRSDLVILAVNDDAIAAVVAEMKVDALVVHTSGSTGIEVLKNCSALTGVIYPLQTFSKTKAVDFSKVPLLIEGNTPEATDQLTALAGGISGNITLTGSAERLALHVAAVFACNFSNHCYSIAASIIEKMNLDFSLLQPLIAETAAKVIALPPVAAQTGPAKRNDRLIMNKHLEFLNYDPELAALYELVSQRIINFKE